MCGLKVEKKEKVKLGKVTFFKVIEEVGEGR